MQRTEIEIETADNEGNDVVRKAEVDEMQSFVGKKENQRWLWHAIDHCTGEILAYVLGSRLAGSVSETKEIIRAFRNQKIFNRWFKNLPKASARRDATSEQV